MSEMDKHSQTRMSIERLPDGGYVVFRGAQQQYDCSMPLMATAQIGEALSYIQGMITPAPTAAEAPLGYPGLRKTGVEPECQMASGG